MQSTRSHICGIWKDQWSAGCTPRREGFCSSSSCTGRIQAIAAAITQGRCHAKPYENEDEELLKETFGKKGLLEEIRKENEPELLETISPQHLEKCLNGIEEIIDELPSEQTMFRLLEKADVRKPFMISDLMNRLFCQASGLLLIQEDG